MKQYVLIGMFFLLAFAACHKAVETRQGTSLQPIASPELSAIDSLMWQRPDSALALLLPCFDTCRDAMLASPTDDADTALETHSMRLYNRHYAHLLLAELLYKNDYSQTNRAELQQAVAYFDSLVLQAPPTSLRAKRGNPRGLGGLKTPNPTANLFFLAARAYYINGVGYYENDSAVQACKEYLKALETMENHFAEKALVGKKAKFMAYTYNRLGGLFSSQFMMKSAILCYKEAQVFCLVETTSPQGISNNYYRIGIQYNMIGQNDSAMYYFDKALENLPDSNGLIYRNISANKALLYYQMSNDADLTIQNLKDIIRQSTNESEKVTRYLTLGTVYFEERRYDSAKFYLECVFENNTNNISKIRAAECLRFVYDSIVESEKAYACVNYLANHKKSEGENKALTSELKDIFQAYLNHKQEQNAAREKKEAILRTVKILVPIALVIVFGIVAVVRKSAKKHLAAQQQAHRMEQAALSGRLKKSNEALREMKSQIKRLGNTQKPDEAASFVEEPICRLIMERVNDGQFLSQMDCRIYKDYVLSKEDVAALREAADRHFHHFTSRLAKAYPELTKVDLDYCCLYLLGLTDADIAALMQRAYNTVNERSSKLKRIFGCNNGISATLNAIANDKTSI